MSQNYIVIINKPIGCRIFTGLQFAEALQLVPTSLRRRIKRELLADPTMLITGNWGKIMRDDEETRHILAAALDSAKPPLHPSAIAALKYGKSHNSSMTGIPSAIAKPPSRPEVVAKAKAKRDRRAARLTAQLHPAPQ